MKSSVERLLRGEYEPDGSSNNANFSPNYKAFFYRNLENLEYSIQGNFVNQGVKVSVMLRKWLLYLVISQPLQ